MTKENSCFLRGGTLGFIFILGGILGLFGGCIKTDDYLFEIPYETSVEIQGGLNILETHYFTFQLNNLTAQTAQSHGITLADIKEISAGRGTIESLAGDELKFIYEAKLIVYNQNPGSDREAFYTLSIPENTSSPVYLNGTLSNLTSYFQEDTYQIRLKLRLRDAPVHAVPIRLQFSFLAK